MSDLHTCLSRRQCITTLAATAAITSTGLAQQSAAPSLRTFSRYQVKPERSADFRALVKEINALFTKVSHKTASTWWRSQTGPGEFVVVSYHEKYAELNETPAALKAVTAELNTLRSRISQCFERSERVIDEVISDLSIRPPAGAALPNLVRLSRQRVRPEHIESYLQLVKAELLPAVRKSEMPLYLFTRTRFGAPTSEFRSAMGLKAWSELDGESPVVRGFGGRPSYDKFVAKLRPMLVETEYNMYGHDGDLDYRPA